MDNLWIIYVEHENASKAFAEYSAPGLCLVARLALRVHSWTPSLPGPYHTTWHRLDQGTTCVRYRDGISVGHLFAK